MFYGDGIVREKDLPEGLELSPHIRERAQGFFFAVRMNGKAYYVPISKEFKKLLKIRDVSDLTLTTGTRVERVLSDIISSVYLQIRDTVGAEIQSTLSDNMTEAFKAMFARPLSLSVCKELDKRLPAPEKP